MTLIVLVKFEIFKKCFSNSQVTFGVYLNYVLQRSNPYPTLSVGSQVKVNPTGEF